MLCGMWHERQRKKDCNSSVVFLSVGCIIDWRREWDESRQSYREEVKGE